MVATLGSGQNSIGAGMVGVGERGEVWAEKAFGGTFIVEEHKGKDSCFGHWNVGEN